jgi:mycoredoxin
MSVKIYGTWWCGDCTWVRRFFENNHIGFTWIDIDKDEIAEQFVLTTNHGMRSVPTIIFDDGTILVEPTTVELRQKLGFFSLTG